MKIRTKHFRGWNLVILESEVLRVTVAPEKGGDIISALWLPTDTELLAQTRWGLRHRGIASQPGTSETAITEWHPGGWQTLFPNAGDATAQHGTEWAFHGETWITAFDWSVDAGRLVMDADLVRSPFHITKTVQLEGGDLRITEKIENVGGEPIDTMWGQHPAFGGELLLGDAEVFTTATRVRADGDGPDYPWPLVGQSGDQVDLRAIAAPRSDTSHLFYLSKFAGEAVLGILNRDLELRVGLHWNADEYPHAWYWCEAGGRSGFPWFGAAHMLGLEPNTSWPGHGVNAARATGTQLEFTPGQVRVHSILLRVAREAAHR